MSIVYSLGSHEILYFVFWASQIIASFLSIFSSIINIISKVRIKHGASSGKVFSMMESQLKNIKAITIIGFLFGIIDWLFYCTPFEISGGVTAFQLALTLSTMGKYWVVTFIVCAVSQIVLSCIKTSSDEQYSVKKVLWFSAIVAIFCYFLSYSMS